MARGGKSTPYDRLLPGEERVPMPVQKAFQTSSTPNTRTEHSDAEA